MKQQSEAVLMPLLVTTAHCRALRELPSPGKSGSVFFISDDDRFMIKTVRKEEMRLLLELVPKYYAHCLENPDTLLTRFYGVHRVKPINGHHVRSAGLIHTCSVKCGTSTCFLSQLRRPGLNGL